MQNKSTKKKMTETDKQLFDKLDSNTKALWSLIENRFNFFEEIHEKQEKRLKTLENKVAKVEKTLDMKEINFFREVNERKTREKNILLFNSKDSPNAKNTDLRYLKNLFQNSTVSMEVPFDLNLIIVRRLGKNFKKDFNRPLLISMPSVDSVSWVFKNKNEIFTGDVYIANDQTKAQREYYKKLKVEVSAKNGKGDGKFAIRYYHKVPEIIELKNSED